MSVVSILDGAQPAMAPRLRATSALVTSDVDAINISALQVEGAHAVSIALSSTTAGSSWSVAADVSWITFSAVTGTTPATIHASIDATRLGAGSHTATITVTAADGTLSIPVTVAVDPLALTVLRSDPQSTRVYGISEAEPITSASHAYLLEIDTLTEKIIRVLRVGSSATDLAIHHGDNRIYIPNWAVGSLLSVTLDTFVVDRTYTTAPYSDSTRDDVRYVAAGPAGRLIVTSGSPLNSNNVRLLDTTTGKVLSNPFSLEAPVQCNATGRYGFSGGKFSGSLAKYDLAGDTFASVASTRSVGNVGPPTLTPVVTPTGNRIFWRGCVFDGNLQIIGVLADAITCTDDTGAYAFSSTTIYDVDHHRAVGPMPAATAVSAFNAATHRLVVSNGSTVEFCEPVGPGMLGTTTPADGTIISAASELAWTAIEGADGYRVYFGSSADSVKAATVASPEYVGTVTGTSVALPVSATSGRTYYWRVDVMVSGQVAGSQLNHFSLAPVVPDSSAVDTSTVAGCVNVPVSIGLSGTGVGQAWTATVADSWVKLGATAGITPAVLQLNLDASRLPAGTYKSSVTLTGLWGTWSLPLILHVEPLAVLVARSDPRTAKVYMLSEATTDAGPTRGYLLEVDTAAKQISRVVAVGTDATSLALHSLDNYAYVPNWLTGGTLGVNLTSFTVDRVIPTPAYERNAFNGADAFHVAAAAAGRLITEGMDQTVQFRIYDTTNGTLLSADQEWTGGGQCDPSGVFYYHADQGLTSTALEKYDVSHDTFSRAGMPRSWIETQGTSAPVVSEDGSRIYWADAAYRPDLTREAALPPATSVYATTKDGRCAISDRVIYDITNPTSVAYLLPGSGKTSAYNSHTGQIVLQVGTGLGFYPLDPTAPLPTPVLTATSLGAGVQLTWTSGSLPIGYTIQYRFGSSGEWNTLSDRPNPTATSYVVTSLGAPIYFQYRIRADSGVHPSAWSDPVVVTALPALPTVTQSPVSQTVAAGGSVTLSANVSGTAVTVQWYKDGAALAGATDTVLTLSDVSQQNAGIYLAKATNAAGTTTSSAATLTVLSPQIVNFSIRSNSGPADQVLIVGCATDGRKSLLIRGVGPGLTSYGVTEVLANPVLDLYRGETWLAGNDDWDEADNAAAIAATAKQLGAFALAAGAKDAAIMSNLDAGAYTVKVSGSAEGVALAEIYDADVSSQMRLVNVSARSFVGTGDRVLIGGFVVVGSGLRTILVRAVGPTLADFNVSGVLADPRIEVVTTTGVPIANNDDWGGTQTLASVFPRVGAFGLDPASHDAALLVKLPAGNYSAIVRGSGDSTGIALLEIYDVQ